MDNPELKEHIYNELCEKYILKYKPGEEFGIDDVTIDTDFESEES